MAIYGITEHLNIFDTSRIFQTMVKYICLNIWKISCWPTSSEPYLSCETLNPASSVILALRDAATSFGLRDTRSQIYDRYSALNNQDSHSVLRIPHSNTWIRVWSFEFGVQSNCHKFGARDHMDYAFIVTSKSWMWFSTRSDFLATTTGLPTVSR